MEGKQSTDEIRRVAMALDNAIENKRLDAVLSCFADDCEIELLRHSLYGKAGVEKWFDWLFKNIRQIKVQPVIIMAEGNILFEEFIIRARLHSGPEVKSKQSEVLVFENDKIKCLRLYFDRLDFADTVAKDPVSKAVVSRILKKSVEGLTD
ncbi:MAG: nuclear transport factor 2 family protein [Chloroflexota bacterium]|nr:nuclear transport factor 2 family protein [Chloroflexota bacterium]